jgi:hypothetical protein
METREQAAELIDRTLALAGLCHVVFAGEEPGAVGAAMAEVMATYLRGFEDRDERERIFGQWLKTVRNILSIYDHMGKQ